MSRSVERNLVKEDDFGCISMVMCAAEDLETTMGSLGLCTNLGLLQIAKRGFHQFGHVIGEMSMRHTLQIVVVGVLCHSSAEKRMKSSSPSVAK